MNLPRLFEKEIFSLAFLLAVAITSSAQSPSFNVIGYFSGNAKQAEAIQAEKLTHVIFSFCHLKGNRLQVDSEADSITIKKLVKLKEQNPQLKVMLSLGGWGGCATCSEVFASAQGRDEFAQSTLELTNYFKTDGIDLDWEYPAIEGFPGHTYLKEDRENFSSLIKVLRSKLGDNHEISFAAGGFKKFLSKSIDWKAIMPLVDRVNLMTYDLVHGYSTTTGHHTPLYSNSQTTESTDFAVQYLIKEGVAKNKIVIGGAFYARVWENVSEPNHGLYQPGKFMTAIDYKKFDQELSKKNGFSYFWDKKTEAPYFYNKERKLFATGDNKKSIRLKTKYAKDQRLQGIMFWELTLDSDTNGLLKEVDKIKKSIQ